MADSGGAGTGRAPDAAGDGTASREPSGRVEEAPASAQPTSAAPPQEQEAGGATPSDAQPHRVEGGGGDLAGDGQDVDAAGQPSESLPPAPASTDAHEDRQQQAAALEGVATTAAAVVMDEGQEVRAPCESEGGDGDGDSDGDGGSELAEEPPSPSQPQEQLLQPPVGNASITLDGSVDAALGGDGESDAPCEAEARAALSPLHTPRVPDGEGGAGAGAGEGPLAPPLPREPSTNHIDAAMEEYLAEDRAAVAAAQASLKTAPADGADGAPGGLDSAEGPPSDSFVRGGGADLQWAAEKHEMDAETGDQIASAVSYENQRWYPVTGWSASLLPTERARWSSECGKFERLREAWPVPEVWGHPSGECEWVGDWHADLGSHADGEGWEYAVSFKGKFSGKKSASDCVRRRAWFRRARVKASTLEATCSSGQTQANTHAKSDHTTKCGCLDTLKKHEALRLRAYESETTMRTALNRHLFDAVGELQDTERALGLLKQQLEQLQELQMSVVRNLQKMKRPPAAQAAEVLNPVQHLYNSLLDFTLRYADNIKDVSGSSAQGNIRSLVELCRTVEDIRSKKPAVARRGLRRLEKAHTAAGDVFTRCCEQFRRARVDSDANCDMWLLEREYVTACQQFDATFEGYKGEVYAALQAVQDIEGKCIDAMVMVGDRYCDMMHRVGIHDADASRERWFHEDRIPVRDLTRTGDRMTTPAITAKDSPLIGKQGVLEMKGVLSWRKYYAVVTIDHNMYLFDGNDQPPDDAKASYAIGLYEATTLPHPEKPCCFTLHGVASGLLGDAGKDYRFRAASEEEMVDWLVALKRARIHHVTSPGRSPG